MKKFKKVKGNLGTDWLRKYDTSPSGHNLMLEAMSSPDLLSDEQVLYPERDFDSEQQRQQYLKAFVEALNSLTPRQKQVVNAIRNLNQDEAARMLNMKRITIATTLVQIRKKLEKNMNIWLIRQQDIQEDQI